MWDLSLYLYIFSPSVSGCHLAKSVGVLWSVILWDLWIQLTFCCGFIGFGMKNWNLTILHCSYNKIEGCVVFKRSFGPIRFISVWLMSKWRENMQTLHMVSRGCFNEKKIRSSQWKLSENDFMKNSHSF